VNVIKALGAIPSAQHGYFTRVQARQVGLEDFQLTRATAGGFIDRVGHGVYRAAGAGHDDLQSLRVEWLRLDPARLPLDRVLSPTVWVSDRSAAAVYRCGAFVENGYSFISSRRCQSGRLVRVRHRARGLGADDWTVVDGFAVTTVARTTKDLLAAHVDRNHIGRFVRDALAKGHVTPERLRSQLGFDPSALTAEASNGEQATTYQPMTLAALATFLRSRALDDERQWRITLEFLEEFRHEPPDVMARLITEEPSRVDDVRWDAFLAGLAEYLAEKHQLPIPAWVHDTSRRLTSPWFLNELATAQRRAETTSPPPFRERGIFLEPRDLIVV
jgi:hypothetical protein